MLGHVLVTTKLTYRETLTLIRDVSQAHLYFPQSSSALPVSKKANKAEKITLEIHLLSGSTITSCAAMGKLLNLSVPVSSSVSQS